MSFGDFSRINTNVQALSSLRTLQNTNNQLGMRQLRLSRLPVDNRQPAQPRRG